LFTENIHVDAMMPSQMGLAFATRLRPSMRRPQHEWGSDTFPLQHVNQQPRFTLYLTFGSAHPRSQQQLFRTSSCNEPRPKPSQSQAQAKPKRCPCEARRSPDTQTRPKIGTHHINIEPRKGTARRRPRPRPGRPTKPGTHASHSPAGAPEHWSQAGLSLWARPGPGPGSQ